MKLFDLISVLDADMTVHVMDDEKSLFFGTVRAAYADFSGKKLKSLRVSRVFQGFGGLCIDVVEEIA